MIILASHSPRRQELMALITPEFVVEVPVVEEDLPSGTLPARAVQTLAHRKARAIAKNRPDDIVIGADTLVVFRKELLGKPEDEQQAYEMLSMLSGNFHEVFTGVSIQKGRKTKTFFSRAHIEFAKMSEKEIYDYIATGEPMDKAGAYGIQGKGAKFVKGIKGDYFTIMGLPVQKTYKYLKEFKAV